MQPKILIAATTWWAMPARLALAFSQGSAQVYGLCPRGSPIGKVQSLHQEFRYRATRPLASLAKAIRLAKPDLLVPCDDRVIGHLHRLHAGELPLHDLAEMRLLIEKSLGSPSGYELARSRCGFLQLAAQQGIQVPPSATVGTLDALRDWAARYGFPLVLKVDGTWGGSGVRIAHTWEDAERAYTELRRPVSAISILEHISFQDFFPIFALDQERHRQLMVQQFVAGSCANVMLACWKGEVLDSLGVDVLFSEQAFGASSVVRTTSDPEMECAGEKMARALGLSGLCGLDFIRQERTGQVFLIEFNPRATQLGHLRPGGADSLAAVMLATLKNGPQKVARRPCSETLAFFPRSPKTELLYPALHHDVPWKDPALLQELKRSTWNSRRFSAFVYLGLRKVWRLFGYSRRARQSSSAAGSI